jgi:hypothetical protein
MHEKVKETWTKAHPFLHGRLPVSLTGVYANLRDIFAQVTSTPLVSVG